MLEAAKRVHIRGADHMDVCGPALILHDRGVELTATAGQHNSSVEALEEIGVEVSMGIEPELASMADAVVTSAAVASDDAEIDSARQANVSVMSTTKALADLVSGHRVLGVMGTHGRATVSSMVAWILERAGWKPGFVLSAHSNNLARRARDTGGDWFVLELDHKLVSQRAIPCDYVVCNFLESDGPQGTEVHRKLRRSMRAYLESNRRLKESFINLDCLENRRLVEELAMRPTGYALEHRAEFRGKLSEGIEDKLRFCAAHRDRQLGELTVGIPGAYNAVNALGATAAALRLGIDRGVITESLASYNGLENRYTVARGGGVTFVKDLAESASTIQNVVDTAKGDGDGRLVSILEARVARAAMAPDELAEMMSCCDTVILIVDEDGQAAGIEGGMTGYGDALQRQGVEFDLLDADEMIERMGRRVHPGDTILFFGTDTFLRNADHLRARLAAQAAQTPAEKEQPRLDGPLIDGDPDDE